MTASLVTPGSIIAKEGEHEQGEGTAVADGNIISTVVGYVDTSGGSISVTPSKSIVAPVVGDTVLCEVVKLNEKNGEAMILCIEGKPGSIQPQHLYGQFFVTGLVDRFMHQTSDALRRRDVCRAVIKEVEPVVRLDFRERDDCGVLHAICPPCGDTSSRTSTVTGTYNAPPVAIRPTERWPTTTVLDGLNSTKVQVPSTTLASDGALLLKPCLPKACWPSDLHRGRCS